jgi:hypothetical protein
MEPMAWGFQRIRPEKVKMFLRIRSTFVPHDDCACFKFGSISCGKRCQEVIERVVFPLHIFCQSQKDGV